MRDPSGMMKYRAINELQQLLTWKDKEASHARADEILCQLLIGLNHEEVVDEYYKLERWCG